MTTMKQRGSGDLEKGRLEHAVREVLLERGLWEVNSVSPRTSVLEALTIMEAKDVGRQQPLTACDALDTLPRYLDVGLAVLGRAVHGDPGRGSTRSAVEEEEKFEQ